MQGGQVGRATQVSVQLKDANLGHTAAQGEVLSLDIPFIEPGSRVFTDLYGFSFTSPPTPYA